MITRPLNIITRLLLACGAIGSLLFIFIFTFLSFFEGWSNVKRMTISTMVSGEVGFLQTLSFLVSGILFFLFAIGLHRSLVIKEKRTVIAMFALAGLALLLAGIFETHSGDVIPISAWIHHSCALSLFITLPTASLAIIKNCKEHGQDKMAIYSEYSLLGVLLFFVFTMLGIFRIWHLEEIIGLSQRIAITIGFMWVAVLSLFLVKLTKRDI